MNNELSEAARPASRERLDDGAFSDFRWRQTTRRALSADSTDLSLA